MSVKDSADSRLSKSVFVEENLYRNPVMNDLLTSFFYYVRLKAKPSCTLRPWMAMKTWFVPCIWPEQTPQSKTTKVTKRYEWPLQKTAPKNFFGTILQGFAMPQGHANISSVTWFTKLIILWIWLPVWHTLFTPSWSEKLSFLNLNWGFWFWYQS